MLRAETPTTIDQNPSLTKLPPRRSSRPQPRKRSERSQNMRGRIIMVITVALLVLAAMAASRAKNASRPTSQFLGSAENNSAQLIQQGRDIFRFDTFGDEAFWGGQLQLHQAINTLTPRQALALGLKVDSEALPPAVIDAIKRGKVNLDDPAVTRLLIKQNAVLGVAGFFDNKGMDNKGMLSSVGLTCALCHSTVDDSVAPGIGRRIDGLANRDLNVGAIAAAAPNLDPVEDLLNKGLPPDKQVDQAAVRT